MASYIPVMHKWINARFCGLFLVAAMNGCVSSPPEPHEESEPLLQLLTAYIESSQSLKRPPKSEGELRKFLPDDADGLFISPRDGKPYVLKYGINMNDPQLDPTNPPMIAWEQDGKNGVRHAISVMGLMQLDAEQFAKLPTH